MFVTGVVLITVALLVDLASFALGVRRLRGNGASGVPVIGLVAFAAGAFGVYRSGSISWNEMTVYVKSYLLVHLALQFGLLLVLHWLLRLWERVRASNRG